MYTLLNKVVLILTTKLNGSKRFLVIEVVTHVYDFVHNVLIHKVMEFHIPLSPMAIAFTFTFSKIA